MNRLLIPLLIWSAAVAAAEAEDTNTYNFYFQKAPGPENVTQGTAPDVTVKNETVTTTPNSTPTVATAPDESTKERNSIKDWYFNAGVSNWFLADTGKQYRGLTAYAGRRFNRYLAADAGVAFGKREGDYGYPSDYERTMPATMNIYSVGGKVTPLTARLFGWNAMEISGTGGMAYISKLEQFTPYVGLELSLIANPNFAVSFYGRSYLRKENARYDESRPDGYSYMWAKKVQSHAGFELSMRF